MAGGDSNIDFAADAEGCELLTWLEENSLPEIFTYFKSKRMTGFPPSMKAIQAVLQDDTFVKCVKLGKRKPFQRLVLELHPFWKLVPNAFRWKVFEAFVKQEIFEMEDMIGLTSEELLKEVLQGFEDNVVQQMSSILEELRNVDSRGGLHSKRGRTGLIEIGNAANVALEAKDIVPAISELAKQDPMSTRLKISEPRGFQNIHSFAEFQHDIGDVQNFYQLLELCTDRQNGSLVDKFVVPRAEIARFANTVEPNSVLSSASKIRFSRLDSIEQECYGVFGHKSAIVSFLKHLGLLEVSLRDKVENLMQEPGLYAFTASSNIHITSRGDAQDKTCHQRKQTTILVAWPQDDAFQNIQAKSKTTTFLRILTQLCPQVFICLDESCAMAFPSERKPRMLTRRHKYKIQQEVVQEEEFTLVPGFELQSIGGSVACDSKTIVILESTGGAGILAGKICPLRKHRKQFFQRFNKQEASKTLQALTETFKVDLNDMPRKEQFEFFRIFSSECCNIVEQLDAELGQLKDAHEENIKIAWEDIESDQCYKEKVQMIMQKSISDVVSDLWPELSAAIIPDQDRLNTAMKAVENSQSADVQEVVSQSMQEWRILEKVIMSVVVFLELKARKISAAEVSSCLDEVILPRTDHVSQITRFISKYFSKDKKLDWKEVQEKRSRLSEPDVFCKTLSKDSEQSSTLLRELSQALLQKLVIRVDSIVKSGPLSVTCRKQHLKRKMDQQLENVRGPLRNTALSNLHEAAFPPMAGEVVEMKCLFLRSCELTRNSVISISGELEEAEERMMEFAVHHLAVPQEAEEALRQDPLTSLQPRLTRMGVFQLPASSTIMAGQVVKEEVVVILRNATDSGMLTFVSIFNARQGKNGNTVKKINREVQLAAVDGQNRLVAIYIYDVTYGSKSQAEIPPVLGAGDFDSGGVSRVVKRSEVVVYRFDEMFQRLEQACRPCELHLLSGEAELQSMVFLQGSCQLALADISNRIRIYDVRQHCLLTQTIQLDSAFLNCKLFTTDKGLCLLVLSKTKGNTDVQVQPFMTPSFTRMPAATIKAAEECQWAAIAFGTHRRQDHLCMLDLRSGTLRSNVVLAAGREQSQVITSASGQPAWQNKSSGDGNLQLTPLEYIYYVYDKFPAQAAMDSSTSGAELHVSVLFDCARNILVEKDLPGCVRKYMESVHGLLNDTMKPVDGLRLFENLQVSCLGNDYQPLGIGSPGLPQGLLELKVEAGPTEHLGGWIRKLICLVPVQVARAEDNNFLVLSDGVLVPEEQARSVIECAQNIKLGLHGAILDWWSGPVVAVSSMGKQSTGKSYTLNHLFGLSFEISGARCTDGCWMTLSEVNGVLYVILDFEGLGSFERTDQEDMLLSVFNAALSGLTIFKTEYRLDRDLEQMFARFQAGVGLIKGDERLFKGHLCITIKDVALRDIESIEKEFHSKIEQITEADSSGNVGENFITKMYNGEFTILPFPSLGERAFYTELLRFKEDLEGRPVQFQGGSAFADCMKTLMAKMQLKDWRSLARAAIDARLRYLELHLETAIRCGQAEEDHVLGGEQMTCLDSGEVIADLGLAHYLPDGHQLADSDLCSSLADKVLVYPSGGTSDHDVHMSWLFEKYESLGCSRTGEGHAEWFQQFQAFCGALVRRRVARVTDWVQLNLERFRDSPEAGVSGENKEAVMDAEAAKFIDFVALHTEKLEQEWQICKSSCSRCYLNCLSTKDHAMDLHSCMGSHECLQPCLYCQEDGEHSKCAVKMGHPGQHDCRLKDHTCGQQCVLSTCLGCNKICAQKSGHQKESGKENTEHICSAQVHLCGQACSAFDCAGKCQIVYGKEHLVHKCMEAVCTHKCAVEGCNQTCSARDHFHGAHISALYQGENGIAPPADLDKYNGLHFCGRTHACPDLCEIEGICKVSIGLVQEGTEEFVGKRGSFTFRTVSEANGEREECRIKIPEFKLKHEGLHRHSKDAAVIHYCDFRCPTCLYFCEQAYGHKGAHAAAHGMMRKCHFVSDQQDIDVGHRKYMVGESGRAEMCDMFCRDMGRGHIHILHCDAESSGECTHAAKDGRHHESCKYGPDPMVPKDELTHGCYWATIGWKDPCSAAERKMRAQKSYPRGSQASCQCIIQFIGNCCLCVRAAVNLKLSWLISTFLSH